MRIIALLALLCLSACSMFSKEAEDFSCPKVGFIANADTVSLPEGEALINGFNGSCSFSKKTSQVEIDLTLPFKAKMTAPPAGNSLNLSYFIAVLSPDEAILQRQSFTTNIDFDNTGAGGSTEEHRIKIPLSASAEAYKYKVVIGFIQTPEPAKPVKTKNKHKGKK
jgi:hypothetical protein